MVAVLRPAPERREAGPIALSHEVVPVNPYRPQERHLRALVNTILPWRLGLGTMTIADLRTASRLLDGTARMCDDYAEAKDRRRR